MITFIIKHRYALIIISFLLWITFFDSSNLLATRKLLKEKEMLLSEKAYYQTEIEKSKQERDELFGNKDNLEKFGREKYLMKRDDEDLFILVE
jgi:cell division protein DivIC